MIIQLFAVERYDDSGGVLPSPAVFPALPAGLRLAGTVYLPADQVVLALVEGPDETSVAAAVAAAGWRVDRISRATWVTASLLINPPRKAPR